MSSLTSNIPIPLFGVGTSGFWTQGGPGHHLQYADQRQTYQNLRSLDISEVQTNTTAVRSCQKEGASAQVFMKSFMCYWAKRARCALQSSVPTPCRDARLLCSMQTHSQKHRLSCTLSPDDFSQENSPSCSTGKDLPGGQRGGSPISCVSRDDEGFKGKVSESVSLQCPPMRTPQDLPPYPFPGLRQRRRLSGSRLRSSESGHHAWRTESNQRNHYVSSPGIHGRFPNKRLLFSDVVSQLWKKTLRMWLINNQNFKNIYLTSFI